MPNTWFRFKQFTVHQDRCAMKVGTDGVLLGAWVKPPKQGLIFDFGTGTGLIALMIAQRSEALIVAFESNQDAVEQAQENFNGSPWADRITAKHADIFQCEEPANKADFIVCNPPFHQSHVLPDEEARKQARHNDIPLKLWFEKAYQWSNLEGKSAFIFPYERFAELKIEIEAAEWFIENHTTVISSTDKTPVRSLVLLCKEPKETIEFTICIENGERGKYHEDFIKIAKPYYLAMPD
jgi:tRNA1Val (adenine37-N6)-methyltransferase